MRIKAHPNCASVKPVVTRALFAVAHRLLTTATDFGKNISLNCFCSAIPFSSTINDKKQVYPAFFVLTKTASTIKITMVYLKEQVDACSQKSFF
jgi:hypothetical protein